MSTRESNRESRGETLELTAAAPKTILDGLLGDAIILAESWEDLSEDSRNVLQTSSSMSLLLQGLVDRNLLTRFQASRIAHADAASLQFGNYRIIDQLGAGAAGKVVKARHYLTRRLVAIKILAAESAPSTLAADHTRFRNEIRVIAHFQHPHIVQVMDAGELPIGVWGDHPVLYYVMEYVDGRDLQSYVVEQGPQPSEKACTIACQVGAALAEVHRRRLVHRDIKPSNILWTAKHEAKVLDFGLVLQEDRRMTATGSVLGTLDYLAPEQARDSADVDIRADVYALGGVLFWCLTGRPPFPTSDKLFQEVIRRQTQPPPLLRQARPEAPAALEAIIVKMMATDPKDRYQSPDEAVSALAPFSGLRPAQIAHSPSGSQFNSRSAVNTTGERVRVLIVDDETSVRSIIRLLLQSPSVECVEAANGVDALASLYSSRFDLVLTDWQMPGMDGLELSRRLRADNNFGRLKIIVISSVVADADVAAMLDAGVDDYVVKPFSPLQLKARVSTVLRLQRSQDYSEQVKRDLTLDNQRHERDLAQNRSDLLQLRDTLFATLAGISSLRDGGEEAHLERVRRGSRHLANLGQSRAEFASEITDEFIARIERTAAVHDVGEIGLPDELLHKTGSLDGEELAIMESHASLGGDWIERMIAGCNAAAADAAMATAIARSHHERFDGAGYPARLVGTAIPLPARIVAIIDSYFSMRRRRVSKPALNHDTTMKVLAGDEGRFDPQLFAVFSQHHLDFNQIHNDVHGS